MSASESTPLSLERLRKQAKLLLRACRAGDATALARVRAGEAPQLADVQHALAREHGYASWAELKHALEAAAPLSTQAQRFFEALHEGAPARARDILAAHPELTRYGVPWAAAAADAEALLSLLREDRAAATRPLGPQGWTPLHAAALSPSLDEEAVRRTVEVLLDHGADPSDVVGPDDGRLSALFRAFHSGHLRAARLLLERGANPNDGECVYHMAEHDDHAALDLLLEFGADVSARQAPYNNTPLYFLAGYRERHHAAAAATRGMRWLLEHGADPNVTSLPSQETALHRVVEFGRSAAVIEMLLEHGADPTLARADGRTPYVLAVRAGNPDALRILGERGVRGGELTAIDRLLGACRLGDLAAARALLAQEPDLLARLTLHDRAALVQAAEDGSVEAVRTLLDIGFDPGWEGEWGGTALHQAAWRGDEPLVDLLLARGAPVDFRDRTYGSSPLGWAAHGSVNFRSANEEYARVIERLIAAGSTLAPAINRWGRAPHELASPAIAALLRERGFVPGP